MTMNDFDTWQNQKFKIKNRTTVCLRDLLGIYLKKVKSLSQRDMCSTTFIAAFLTVAQTWEQTECPLTGEWAKEL